MEREYKKKNFNIHKNTEILKKQIEKRRSKKKILLKVSPKNKKLPTKNCFDFSQIANLEQYKYVHKHSGKSPDKKCQYCWILVWNS